MGTLGVAHPLHDQTVWPTLAVEGAMRSLPVWMRPPQHISHQAFPMSRQQQAWCKWVRVLHVLLLPTWSSTLSHVHISSPPQSCDLSTQNSNLTLHWYWHDIWHHAHTLCLHCGASPTFIKSMSSHGQRPASCMSPRCCLRHSVVCMTRA